MRHERLTEKPSLLASLSSGTITFGALSLAKSSSRTPASVGTKASETLDLCNITFTFRDRLQLTLDADICLHIGRSRWVFRHDSVDTFITGMALIDVQSRRAVGICLDFDTIRRQQQFAILVPFDVRQWFTVQLAFKNNGVAFDGSDIPQRYREAWTVDRTASR